MTDIAHRLVTVLELLPVAVGLVSSSGRVLGKAGGMANLLGDMIPSRDAREFVRWTLTDRTGAILPSSQYPSDRALRGEQDYVGAIGTYHDADGDHAVKVISMPTGNSHGDIAAVTFVQLLDTKNRSIDGSHFDLQQKLIDNLAQAVASGWNRFDLMFDAFSAVETPTPT